MFQHRLYALTNKQVFRLDLKTETKSDRNGQIIPESAGLVYYTSALAQGWTTASDRKNGVIWLDDAQSVSQTGMMEPYHLKICRQEVIFLKSTLATSAGNINQE